MLQPLNTDQSPWVHSAALSIIRVPSSLTCTLSSMGEDGQFSSLCPALVAEIEEGSVKGDVERNDRSPTSLPALLARAQPPLNAAHCNEPFKRMAVGTLTDISLLALLKNPNKHGVLMGTNARACNESVAPKATHSWLLCPIRTNSTNEARPMSFSDLAGKRRGTRVVSNYMQFFCHHARNSCPR